METIRAQTASASQSSRQRHTSSNLKVGLPTNISFLVEEENVLSGFNEDCDVNYTTTCTMKSYGDTLLSEGDEIHTEESKYPSKNMNSSREKPTSANRSSFPSGSRSPLVSARRDSFSSMFVYKHNPAERKKERCRDRERDQCTDDDDHYSDDFVLELPDQQGNSSSMSDDEGGRAKGKAKAENDAERKRVAELKFEGGPRSPNGKSNDSFSELFYY
jgi:hypothetical protein